jgi:hypothetical protein
MFSERFLREREEKILGNICGGLIVGLRHD